MIPEIALSASAAGLLPPAGCAWLDTHYSIVRHWNAVRAYLRMPMFRSGAPCGSVIIHK